MGAGVLAAATVLWVIPTFVGHALGKPRRRSGIAYGFLLGWLGVLILLVLPPLPEPPVGEQLARLERHRRQLPAAHVAKEETRLRARLATAPRECPSCKEPMRRDATVCPHCHRDSEAWIYVDGQWRARSGKVWFALVESSGEWQRLDDA